jgi:hypothetical protein
MHLPRARHRIAFLIAFVILFPGLVSADSTAAGARGVVAPQMGYTPGGLSRTEDPVVLKGSDLPKLVGAIPSLLRGFMFSTKRGWVEIPIQVDEVLTCNTPETADRCNFQTIYNYTSCRYDFSWARCYADPTTRAGADPVIGFDEDDELVFMSGDVGSRYDAMQPLEVPDADCVPGSGVLVEVRDGRSGNTEKGWVYLFRSTAPSQVPGYITSYSLALVGGPYLSVYTNQNGLPPLGPHPETSTVETPNYKVTFRDRWICNGMYNKLGASGGAVNMIERRKKLTLPSATSLLWNCTRSENSASGYMNAQNCPSGNPQNPGTTCDPTEGAFIANVVGRVRAIRSFLGFNSGPLMQRDHYFYRSREDVVSYTRVHGGGVASAEVIDYNKNVVGMTYRVRYSDAAGTVGNGIIDGNPANDSVNTELPIAWELVRGPEGSLAMTTDNAGSVIAPGDPVPVSKSYWRDVAADQQGCNESGGVDATSWGMSGSRAVGARPCTDPNRGCDAQGVPAQCTHGNTLTSKRIIYYCAPAISVSDAAQLVDGALNDPDSIVTSIP